MTKSDGQEVYSVRRRSALSEDYSNPGPTTDKTALWHRLVAVAIVEDASITHNGTFIVLRDAFTDRLIGRVRTVRQAAKLLGPKAWNYVVNGVGTIEPVTLFKNGKRVPNRTPGPRRQA